jgi:hypothetical protein
MAGRYQSPQVLFLREARNLLDPGPNDARVLILSLPEHPLRDSLIRQLRLHQVSFAESSLVERDAQSAGPDIDDPRSIVLLGLRLPEALADRLESRLERAGKRPCRFRTSMGEVHLVVWASPGELWRCAQAPFRW